MECCGRYNITQWERNKNKDNSTQIPCSCTKSGLKKWFCNVSRDSTYSMVRNKKLVLKNVTFATKWTLEKCAKYVFHQDFAYKFQNINYIYCFVLGHSEV